MNPERDPEGDPVLEGLGEILSRMGVEDAASSAADIRRDLGLDSLRRIELVIEVENRFRVRLEPEDEAKVESLGDLADVIRRRAAEGHDAGRDADAGADTGSDTGADTGSDTGADTGSDTGSGIDE